MSTKDARREISEMKASFSKAMGDSVEVLTKALAVLSLAESGHVEPRTVAELCALLIDALRSLRDQAVTWQAVEAVMAVVEQPCRDQ